ncbi:kinesin light chain 1 [Ophiostoma piceae UAMH 11346]|uniref:Kinesin light chain 1 n=1 Tax=Ophiostoma piceae (strain UAMH 11346) TaxID=1262450 RepID=S3BZW2_OPHP1|nr:kinesin light chain 1 [Ophiostoma piceae UAMH 11346]
MRLLECSDGKFKPPKNLVANIPRYAILSHTWGTDDEEVTFQDLVNGTEGGKTGFEKLMFCAAQAKHDGLRYFWVDTCCIDRSNNSELSEALNSMFAWYRDADRCYAYLSDISTSESKEDGAQSELAWESAFRASRWFTRGWTLQELLAPASVEFFSAEGHRLGDKRSLEQPIHEITGIAIPALRAGAFAEFDVEERFRWAKSRETSRAEDWAYCLLGIFGIFMSPIYGEGKEHAVRRLRQKIAANAPMHKKAKNRTWMVPFDKNPSFTGRQSDLNGLRQALFTGDQTTKVAIVGLGGIGKTQLALSLAYQTRDENENCSVIWMPATSKESIGQAYLHAAQQLGISGWEDEKADVKRLVQDHLSSESAGQWLLIFDNADDVNMWVDKSAGESARLIDYLPKSRHGSIIFTTRDRKTAIKLAGRNIVEMSVLDEAGSERLLRNYLYDEDLLNDQGDVSAFLAQLTYLPLAIVQAAAYINQNGIDLADYLSLLDAQEEDVIDLLSEDFEDERRYLETKNPVATTWLISFERVRQRDSLAAEYLSFMACIDAKDIPQSLLPPNPSPKKVIDAIGTLKGYSFISQQSTGSAINIHRLVHLSIRNWLRKEGLLSVWTGQVIARLADVFTDAGYGNRDVWRTYMPHAYYAIGPDIEDEDDKNRLTLLSEYGRCLSYDGRYNEAESIFQRVTETRTTTLGADHPDTLASLASLALTFRDQGRWDEAEKLLLQLAEIRKATLGADHPDTTTSLANLAVTYGDQDRWEEAEKLLLQVVKITETQFGADHSDTLSTKSNLALAYKNQGRWNEAEKLQVQVMEASKTILGADHPDTLIYIANLASTYKTQCRWDEAEKLEVQVVETSKTKLGADHPFTLGLISNLAFTLWNQDRWDEATKMNEQVMETRKIKLGPDHRYTLESMAILASRLYDQGQLDEAEKLRVQVIEARKTKLGADHSSTLKSISSLASMFWDQGRHDEAKRLEAQVMEASRTKFGADHPGHLTRISSFASTYKAQGRWDEAGKLEEEVMETSKTKLGADHPDTLTRISTLASTYSVQERLDEAERLRAYVMETRKTKFGADHSSTLESMTELAWTFLSQGRWDEAEKLQEQVLETSKMELGADHPDTETRIDDLIRTYKLQERRDMVEKLEVQLMETRKARLGADHPDTLRSMYDLAYTWRCLGLHTEALALMKDCAQARQRTLGSDDEDTAVLLACPPLLRHAGLLLLHESGQPSFARVIARSALTCTAQLTLFDFVCHVQGGDGHSIPARLQDLCQSYYQQHTEMAVGYILQQRFYLFKIFSYPSQTAKTKAQTVRDTALRTRPIIATGPPPMVLPCPTPEEIDWATIMERCKDWWQWNASNSHPATSLAAQAPCWMSKIIRRRHSSLAKAASSLLTQFRTGLCTNPCRRQAVDSPACRCGSEEDIPAFVVLECPAVPCWPARWLQTVTSLEHRLQEGLAA